MEHHYKKLFELISKEVNSALSNDIGFNALKDKSGLAAPVLVKFRDNLVKSPTIDSLEKIAVGLDHSKSHFIDLLQYFDGQTAQDPRKPVKMESNASAPFRFKEDHYKRLPVLKATAGQPFPFIDDHAPGHADRYEWAYIKDMPNAFFVEVDGDSMTGSGIAHKDYCLVNPNAQVENGDVVLAIGCDDGATIKKYKQTEKGIMLSPTNPAHEPIFINMEDAVDCWKFYKIIETRHKF